VKKQASNGKAVPPDRQHRLGCLTACKRSGRKVCIKLVWRRDLIPDIVHIDMHVDGGKLYSAGASGVGVVLDEAAALTHPYLPSGLHILRRDDRSVSDW
jgi:hypothetical protein